jgi:hypothetical protein
MKHHPYKTKRIKKYKSHRGGYNFTQLSPLSYLAYKDIISMQPLAKAVIGTTFGALGGVLAATLKKFSSYDSYDKETAYKRELHERVPTITNYAVTGSKIGYGIGFLVTVFEHLSNKLLFAEKTASGEKIIQTVNELINYLQTDFYNSSFIPGFFKIYLHSLYIAFLQLASYYQKTTGFIADSSTEPIFNLLGVSHHSRAIFYSLIHSGMIGIAAGVVAKYVYQFIMYFLDGSKNVHDVLGETISIIENNSTLTTEMNLGKISEIFITISKNLRALNITLS